MKIEQLAREFHYNGLSLPDPGAQHTPEQVRDMYSAAYPEITTAAIEGPEKKGDKLVYTFKRAVGTKGATLEVCPEEADGLTYIKVMPNGFEDPVFKRLAKALKPRIDKFGELIDKYLFAYWEAIVRTLRDRLQAQADGVLPVGSAPIPERVGVSDSEKKECVQALRAVLTAKSGEKLFPPSGIMPLIC